MTVLTIVRILITIRNNGNTTIKESGKKNNYGETE